jgi:class 3 adenylate cyclase
MAESFKRKLAAILSADVKGYSRLMGEDEAETVKTITAYRKIMEELIQQHRGRVIDSPGDNILAEFASVVDAVQCAVAAQNEFKARNAELPENRRMEFRIGVNLGDVIEEESRIYGDGVNIAARLESLADPSGICISKTAFDHIETKLPFGYEYLGEQTVKNIAKPVGAYRVLMDPRVTVAGAEEKKVPVPLWRRKGVLAGAMAVLIVIIGAAVWSFYWRATQDTQRIEKARAAAEKEAGRAATDEARMTLEAQRKAELERTARDAAEREAKLRAELLTVKGKAEQERIAREAAQREAKLQAEQERTAREAAQREAKLQVEQERIVREAAQRETKLQVELKAAQVELQQAEASKKQATQQAAVTAAVPQKAASLTRADPDRYDGTYQGRMCTDSVGKSKQTCRPVTVTVKQGTVSGSFLSGASGKRSYLKGTIAPEGAVKLTLDAFNRNDKPITGTMTGAWSDNTIATSGTWRHNGSQVKAILKREP